MDLVPSDVLASFLLAAAMQRADRAAALRSVLTGSDSSKKIAAEEKEILDIASREPSLHLSQVIGSS